MRVTQSATLQSILPQLNKLTEQQNIHQKEISTGKRIHDISDNPASAARILQSQSDQKQLIQQRDNTRRADTLSQLGQNNMSLMKDLAGQATDLINQSSTGGLITLVPQIEQLISDTLSVANTEYNGDYLHGGTVTDTPPFAAVVDPLTGETTGFSYLGSADPRSFTVAGDAEVTPFTSGQANSEINDFLNHLVALRDAASADDRTTFSNISTQVETDEDNFVASESDLAYTRLRLEVLQARDNERYRVLDENVTEEIAADQTEAIVNLLNTQQAYQGALQATRSIMDLSILNYV